MGGGVVSLETIELDKVESHSHRRKGRSAGLGCIQRGTLGMDCGVSQLLREWGNNPRYLEVLEAWEAITKAGESGGCFTTNYIWNKFNKITSLNQPSLLLSKWIVIIFKLL